MKIDFEKEYLAFVNATQNMTDSEIEKEISENYNRYFPSMPSGEYKRRLLRKMRARYLNSLANKQQITVTICHNEVDFLRSLPTDKIKRLFYSLIIRSKIHPYKSGWISMDFENTIKYGFGAKGTKNIRLEDLQECKPFGLETLVIGSTKPMLCFKLPLTGEGEVAFEFNDDEALKMFAEVGYDK